jgi:hypothetical protein
MKEYIPLLVAFAGAFFGTLFAIAKTKKEKLWLEKYETLKEIIHCADLIRHQSSHTAMDALGIKTITESEKTKMNEELLESKMSLRKSVLKLRLLFKSKDISKIQNNYDALSTMMVKLVDMDPDVYRIDYHDEIEMKATDIIESVVSLSERKCT